MYDVIAFGEALLRLTPPGFMRLEQTNSFNLNIGGSELNVAVGVNRLGLKSCWVSKLPLNPLGYLIRNKAREQGVDTSHIVWSKEGRVGVYFQEFGASPRPSSVIYDRRDSVFSKIKPDEIQWERIFKDSKIYIVSGITPALSNSAKEITVESIKAAKKSGCKVCIDLNYRAKLWTEEEARKCMVPLMDLTDILVTGKEDTFKVLGIEGKDYKEVAKILHDRFGLETVVITLREDVSVWRNNWTAIAFCHGKFYETKNYELEIVERVGGGDSFTAGFLYGYLTGDVQKGIDYGVAFSALKHSHPSDFCWCSLDEVETLLKDGSLRIRR